MINIPSTQIERLQKIQNKAARLILWGATQPAYHPFVAARELGIFVKPIRSLTFKCLALGVGHHVRDYGESTHVGLGQLLIGCSIVTS